MRVCDGKSRARRVITKAIVFLLLGAVINIAFAWGIILNGLEIGPDTWTPLSVEEGAPLLNKYHSFDGRTIEVVPGVDERVPGLRHALAEGHDAATGDSYYASETRCGWPFLSMGCYFRAYDIAATPGADHKQVHQTLTLENGLPWLGVTDRRHLPLMPVWGGFIFNTLIYAAIIWLLIGCIGFLRSQWRSARGLCRKCKYPIGHSPVCTECGRSVKPRESEITA